MKHLFFALAMLAAMVAHADGKPPHPNRPFTNGEKPLIIPFPITEPAMEADNRRYIRRQAQIERRKQATMKACKEKPEACTRSGRKLPARQA